jgi:hypothetical protein
MLNWLYASRQCRYFLDSMVFKLAKHTLIARPQCFYGITGKTDDGIVVFLKVGKRADHLGKNDPSVGRVH